MSDTTNLADAARAERDSSEQRQHMLNLTKQLEAVERQYSDLRTRFEIAEANAAANAEALSEAAAAAQRDAERLREELEVHKQWLTDIQGSLSWRITRPLRRAASRVRGRGNG